MKKIAIMQPYFFPYIGYFQLIHAVDEFVVYDKIEFSRRGWINRNRILVGGADSYITLPLKKDSDYLPVCRRHLADSWPDERSKMINRISGAYRKAPFFGSVFELVKDCLHFQSSNLFDFLFHSIKTVAAHLEIKTPLIVSSQIEHDETLKSEQRVIALCHAREATYYLNPIGGLGLYDKHQFKRHGIDLWFHRALSHAYPQFDHAFVPFLSIIDVMMFNSSDRVKDMLTEFTVE
jgi:hypothetical protein